MFKFGQTIQGRIFRTLILVSVSVLTLTGVSFYAIFEAKDAFKRTTAELNAISEHVRDLRATLERIMVSRELMTTVKGETTAHVDTAREAEAKFRATLDVLRTENAKAPWLPELDRVQSELESGDLHKIQELRAKLNQIYAQIGRYQSDGLFSSLQALALLILGIAGATLILPPVLMWVTTRRVNQELSQFVRTLNHFSEQNDQTSENLRNSSQDLSSASGEQSAAVQETVASIAEIRSMLSQTSNHVREVRNLTSAVNEKTHDGSQIMTRMESSMMAIEQANSQLQSFEEIIRSIREKTQVINDIVFKTQLLSFNASIEAARAGQYGRGFAVVAEEVGKLAHLSGGASKDIDQLLSDSQKRVSQIVEAVEERVRDGKEVSGEALKRFGEIASQITIISEKVNQVGEATLEQEGGVEQTARAMDQMDETALDSKKSAEQILAIAERLRHLSAKIREVTEGIRRYVREDRRTRHSDVESGDPSAKKPADPANAEKVVSLVSRLAQKRAGSSPVANDPTEDIDADDPSFRKTK